MAAPTRTEIETGWKAAIKLYNETYKYGSVNSSNFVNLIDSLEQNLEGDFTDEAVSAAYAMRNQLSGCVSIGMMQALFRPWLRMYCRHVIGRTDLSSDVDMLSQFYRYFIDNSLRVQGRAFTYGTPAAAAGNIGTTQIIRLTRDRYNFPLESGHVDSKKATCILDSNTGTSQGNETWYFEGQVAARDDLQRSGSGLSATLTGQTPDNSLLSNSDFRSFGNTTTDPDDVTDWTYSGTVSGSTIQFTSDVFRVAPSNSSSSAYSMILKDSGTLSQKLTVRGTEMDPDTPYIFAMVWKRGSASGTLTQRMGAISNAISVSAQSGWTVSLCPATPTWACWYRVMAEDDLQIDIQWAKSSGDITIGEAMLLPMTYFDGSYYLVLPNSATSWIAPRVDDKFTWPDIATDSIIQRALARAWPGFYLPSSIGSSITWADPT